MNSPRTKRPHRWLGLSSALALTCALGLVACDGRQPIETGWDVTPFDNIAPTALWTDATGAWVATRCGGLGHVAPGQAAPKVLRDMHVWTGITSVAPCSPTTAWAVGRSGLRAAYYDGQRWQQRDAGLDGELGGIWCRNDDEAWAFDIWGSVWRFGAGSWKRVHRRPADWPRDARLTSIAGRCTAAGCRVWIAGSGRALLIDEGVVSPWMAVAGQVTRVRSYTTPEGGARVLLQREDGVFELEPSEPQTWLPRPEERLPLGLHGDRVYLREGMAQLVEVAAGGVRTVVDLPELTLPFDLRAFTAVGVAASGQLWVAGVDRQIGVEVNAMECMEGDTHRGFVARRRKVR